MNDVVWQDETERVLLNGAVYHAKCIDHFKVSNPKRAEKSYILLQFYKEFLDIHKIIKNYSQFDVEKLKPKEKRILHPADRMVLAL